MADERGERVPIMGLYEQTGRNGKYLRGKLGRAMVWIFKNDRKQKDTDPDWTAYVTADRPKPGTQASPPPQRSYPSRAPVAEEDNTPTYDEAPAARVGTDDDIPF
jgi:hypothetical protein